MTSFENIDKSIVTRLGLRSPRQVNDQTQGSSLLIAALQELLGPWKIGRICRRKIAGLKSKKERKPQSKWCLWSLDVSGVSKNGGVMANKSKRTNQLARYHLDRIEGKGTGNGLWSYSALTQPLLLDTYKYLLWGSMISIPQGIPHASHMGYHAFFLSISSWRLYFLDLATSSQVETTGPAFRTTARPAHRSNGKFLIAGKTEPCLQQAFLIGPICQPTLGQKNSIMKKMKNWKHLPFGKNKKESKIHHVIIPFFWHRLLFWGPMSPMASKGVLHGTMGVSGTFSPTLVHLGGFPSVIPMAPPGFPMLWQKSKDSLTDSYY